MGRHQNRDEFRSLSTVLGHAQRPGPGIETILLVEEAHVLEEFRKWFASYHAGPRIPSPHSTEWLDLAQHHGAPTRLLDVTRYPLVGLFFACWDDEHVCDDTVDGIVYVKDGGSSVRWQDVRRRDFVVATEVDAEIQQGIADNYLDFFEPWALSRVNRGVNHRYRPLPKNAEINKRLEAQAGEFIWNTEMTRLGDWFPVLVPGNAKARILRQLSALQLNPATLFPDSASRWRSESFQAWLKDDGPLELHHMPQFEWTWAGVERHAYPDLLV